MTMKFKITTILAVVFALVFTSCANDDETPTDQNENILETPVLLPDYFPVSSNNYWSYRVITGSIGSIDSIHVTAVDENSFTLGLNAHTGGRGIMSNILTNGVLTKQGNALTLNGSIDFGLELLTHDVIEFEGLVLYDIGRSNGDVLFSHSGTYEDDLSGNPLTVDYTLRSVKQGELDSVNFDGTPYRDVEVIDIILDISVDIELLIDGVPTTFELAPPQQILKIQTYFAAEIGLVKSGTIYRYTLNPSTLELLHSLAIDWLIESDHSIISLEELRAFAIEE